MPDDQVPGDQVMKDTPAAQHVSAPPRAPDRPADPCTMVIFGAGGDLTKRLVVPALYNLSRTGTLPENFALVGVDLAPGSAESWGKHLLDALNEFVGNPSAEFHTDHIDMAAWNRLASRMYYLQGDLTKPDLYQQIGTMLQQTEREHQTKNNAIFYLAIADRFFATVVEHLGEAKLTDAPEDKDKTFWRRVVIEKPFGHSLDSARELNAKVLRVLHEDQVFRIDHFLGKETVQNIMAFRFANGLFEPIWNRDRIDHVQITVAETVGVEKRGKFYEQTGALRDMVPNHVFQLLAMVAMEPPVRLDALEIRNKKAEVFQAMPPVKPVLAVRGQYGPGKLGAQDCVPYRQEPDVSPNSTIETYVAMELEIDNWRWSGVPFFLRTGKHLSRRMTEIAIRFKQAPYAAFSDTPVDRLRPNWLVIRIQPDEGISLQFEVKRPGPVVDLAAVKMDFRYKDWFPPEPNVGYETLLYDVMIGDATLFSRDDMVEATWRVVQPVLDAWASGDCPVYPSGSEGPPAADALIAANTRLGKRRWRPIDGTDEPQHA